MHHFLEATVGLWEWEEETAHERVSSTYFLYTILTLITSSLENIFHYLKSKFYEN